MDLTSIKVIKNLFKKYQTYPSKRLGQNFLIDKNVIKKIIKGANGSKLLPIDIVLEIGPGIGVLTKELAKKVHPVKSREAGIPLKAGLFNRAGKVIACEKDPKMVEILKETLKDFKNIEIINNDILKIEPKNYNLKAKSYKIVANLPYYITSPVIRMFLENENPPKEMTLMVQKEVAQRICSKPPDMSLLAVAVQFYAKPEIISYVPKESFWPQPKVDAAILRIAPRINADRKRIDADLFFKVVRAGFSHPRKQLANNLSNGLALSLPNGLKLKKEDVKNWLLKNNIKPFQRAETLSIQDWINLVKTVNC